MQGIAQRSPLIGMTALALIVLGTSKLEAQGLGPNGATARCSDGRFSTSRSEKSACAAHGGVATWYGLAPEAGATSASRKPDVFAKLEEIISQEPNNSVLRADKDGSVILRSADSNKVAPYSLFTDFLDKEHQESACRRSSAHCMTCAIPGHRIYCTNVAKFLPLPPF